MRRRRNGATGGDGAPRVAPAPQTGPARPRDARAPRSSTRRPGAAPRSWIFQARRDRLDLLAALESHDTDEWPVVQYRAAIKTGDRVYFWLAGHDAGVYGAGRVLAEPAPSTATPLSTWHVAVGYEHVLLAPLLRRDLLRHPFLAGLTILRQPQGTNFAVDETQARELARLVGLPEVVEGAGEPSRRVAEETRAYSTTEADAAHGPAGDPTAEQGQEQGQGQGQGLALDRAALRGALRLPDAPLDAIATLVNTGRHVIISGPPGTGKTTLALQTAREAHRLGRCWGVVVTTATADWTTFDTIGGYLPAADGVLSFHEGIVLRALRQNAWLVLDELNRADIDRALGPLLTVLSGHPVELPSFVDTAGRPLRIAGDARMAESGYDEERATYRVGGDWRILATMNTEDRQALFGLSFALARRFAVVRLDVPPPTILREIAATVDVPDAVRERVLAVFARSPRRLGPALLMDVLGYIAARGGPDALVEAVEAYVVPQLDGIAPARLRRYVADLRRLLGKPGGERVAAYIKDLLRLEDDA